MRLAVIFCLNPYWQIMENSSRNFSEIFIFWVVTQTVLLENSSNVFSKFEFWGVTQTVLLENSSIFFKIWILGRHTGRFTWKLIHSKSWVFSKIGEILFHFKFYHLLIFPLEMKVFSCLRLNTFWMSISVKRCNSRPVFLKSE